MAATGNIPFLVAQRTVALQSGFTGTTPVDQLGDDALQLWAETGACINANVNCGSQLCGGYQNQVFASLCQGPCGGGYDVIVSVDGRTCEQIRAQYVCTPLVICGEWSACVDGQQTRTCDDGCGTVTTESQACTSPVPPPPEPSLVSILAGILQALVEHIKAFLADIGITFTVTSPDTVVMNTPITTTIGLIAPSPPDVDFSDGTVSKYYGIVFALDENSNVLFNSDPLELPSDTYIHTFDFTPTQRGDIVVGGAILETRAVYDFTTQQWGPWSEAQIVVDDKKVVTVTGVTTPPPAPSLDIGTILQNIVAALQQWFCSTLGLFC